MATLAHWLLSAWQKNSPSVDKLMGVKTETVSDAADFVRTMNSKARAEELEECVNLNEVVTLDLVGEIPLGEWYHTDSDSKEEA